MRLAPTQHRAYTYNVTAPPAVTPVSVAEAKEYLKIPAAVVAQDTIIELFIEAATEYAEAFTRRDLITRTYQTFRDFFPTPGQSQGYYNGGVIPNRTSGISSGDTGGIEIRKSPMGVVAQFLYRDPDDVSQAVISSTYYFTEENDYSELKLLPGFSWPTNVGAVLDVITITFSAGFGGSSSDVPAGYRFAILQHVASMWANRGDCGAGSCADSVPVAAKAFYLQNRIENL